MRRRFSPPPTFFHAFLILVVARRASSTNVTWQSPSDGDVYASGDTIVGQWVANQPVVSPCFSLCMKAADGGSGTSDSDGSCGTKVWPAVSQSDGTYMIYLAVPNVTSASKFYIQMKDDFGDTTDSPTFSLKPALANQNDESALSAAPSAATSVSAPPSPATPATASQSQTAVSSTPTSLSASASVTPSSASSSSTLLPSDTIPSVPNFDAATMPAPTVAYALPLSVVGAVLLAAGALAVRAHRRLRAERDRAALPPQPSTSRSGVLPVPLSRQTTELSAASVSTRTLVDAAPRPYPPTLAAWVRGASKSIRRQGAPHTPAYTGDAYAGAERRATREPPPAHEGRADAHRRRRPTRMTARAFRAAVSPVPPAVDRFAHDPYYDKYDSREGWEAEVEAYARRDADRDRDADVESERNASVNEDVVERYLRPSPVPPALTPALRAPARAHTRKYACVGLEGERGRPARPGDDSALYEAVARKVSGVELERRGC